MTSFPPDRLFILFGISELGLLLFKRAGRSVSMRDRGSLPVLWSVIAIGIYLGIDFSYRFADFGFHLPGAILLFTELLFVGGLILRWWSIIHLGRFFTVNVAVAKDHRVVDDGPYRFVRHPSYSGALLTLLTGGIILGNWLSFLVVFVPVSIAFLWRISLEERALVDALGEDYARYIARTKRLVPFVY